VLVGATATATAGTGIGLATELQGMEAGRKTERPTPPLRLRQSRHAGHLGGTNPRGATLAYRLSGNYFWGLRNGLLFLGTREWVKRGEVGIGGLLESKKYLTQSRSLSLRM